MGIGLSLMLSAAGAVLIWAVDWSSASFDVRAAGVILLVVGVIGFFLSLAFWASWGARGIPTRATRRSENTVTVVDR
ncbi:MAG TPA: hypothetical protein VH063_17280 [Gaiellaceae bacterium]|jgi:hypothetical protein|nr:hypothetical protein [Gaiellaceae bacterium]